MRRVLRYVPAVVLILAFVGVVLQGSLPVASINAWVAGGSPLAQRTGACAVTLADGNVLITGGADGIGNPLASAEIVSKSDGSFSAAAPMLSARSRHACAALPDGRVLVIGGVVSGGGITNDTELYDPSSGTWTAGPPMAVSGRAGHTASVLSDGKVVIAGGENGSAVLAPVEIYDPDANSFSPAGSLTGPRKDHGAAVTLDGWVWVGGGHNGEAELATAEMYDPVTKSSTPAPNMAAPRSRFVAMALPNNAHVLIAGGSSAGSAVASTELYRPWTSSFVPGVGSLGTARSGAAGAPLGVNGYALVAGGSDPASSELFGFATVKTDKADYAPGETVTITGSGWQPGETVALSLREIPLIDEHSLLSVVADANGNIISTEFVPNQYDIGITFILTASGGSSGRQAQNKFTDDQPFHLTVTASPSGAIGGTFSISYTNPGSQAKTATGTTGTPSASLDLLPGTTYTINSVQSPVNGYAYVGTATPFTGTAGTAGSSGTLTLTYQAANTAPTVAFTTAPTSANEGETKTYNFSITDPDAGQTFSFVSGFPDCGTGGSVVTSSINSAAKTGTFQCSFPDGPANPTVRVQVQDSASTPASSNIASVAVSVANLAPVVALSGPVSVNESTSEVTYTFTVSDVPADTYNGGPASCGTGGTLVANSLTVTGNSGSQSGSFKCVFPDGPASPTVSIQFTDDDSGVGSDSKSVTVSNVAPVVTSLSLSSAAISENGSVALSGAFTDPGILDTHSVVIDWGDGTTTVSLSAGLYTFATSHQYLDDNPTGTPSDLYTIKVYVADKDGGIGNTPDSNITVNNVAPVVSAGSSINVPLAPLATPANAGISVNVLFTDAGTQDTHTCKIDFDDGTPLVYGTVAQGAGSGTCTYTGTHTYNSAGVYTVKVTIRDDDTGEVVFQASDLIVVYDPNAGFVTGGGWINSPAGAYIADPTLTGKANFGFVSKYQKGANVPTGETEFQFKAGDMNFHSSLYQWLVVSGAKAQYKGSGTINGEGDYGFLLTATDGELTGGGGVDKFRIKIWDKASSTVVYDNALGAPDDIDAANPQAIQGGSIVIHTAKK